MTSKPLAGIEPRFALLHHAMEAAGGRFDHWDLMLENSGSLITFELDRVPPGPGKITTKRLADHRMTYLDYEGHISGNRGQVVRLDRGRYAHSHDENAQHSRRFIYELKGGRLHAILALDQPIVFVPFGQPVEIEVIQWDWED